MADAEVAAASPATAPAPSHSEVNDLHNKIDILMAMLQSQPAGTPKTTAARMRWAKSRPTALLMANQVHQRARSQWSFVQQQYRLHLQEQREMNVEDESADEDEASGGVRPSAWRRAPATLWKALTAEPTLRADGLRKRWFVSMPDSRFSKLWTLLTALMVLFVAAELPVRLAFLEVDDSCAYYAVDRTPPHLPTEGVAQRTLL
jgi:hypothetical protein